MSRWIRIVSVLLGLLLVAVGGVAVALQSWVSSGDFRGRIEREAAAALGVPVRVRGISVDLWPVPSVALDGVAIGSRPQLTLERVEARPIWLALLRGRLEVATLVVRQAVLPEQAVAVIGAALRQRDRGARTAAAPLAGRQSWWPRRARFDQLSWVPARGATTTVDALVVMDEDGLPASATVKVLRGRLAGASASLKREGLPWLLTADVGGGKVTGKVALQPAKPGAATLLQGSFDIRNVEVAALTAPSRTLTGRLDATTTLRAPLQDLGRVRELLQTQTRFTVRKAVIHGIDLREAVRTVGLSRGGSTALDALSGRLATQGSALQLTELVAAAGTLAATGQVAMATDKSLSGRLSVDLAAAATGVPLLVGGTLDDPSVTLSRGALIGAAIGTAVLPGVGTGAGAKLGDRLGEGLRGLFGK